MATVDQYAALLQTAMGTVAPTSQLECVLQKPISKSPGRLTLDSRWLIWASSTIRDANFSKAFVVVVSGNVWGPLGVL